MYQHNNLAKHPQVIYSVVDKLKCFSRYTPHIKRELATIVYFQQFGDGRVIVQQGTPEGSVPP